MIVKEIWKDVEGYEGLYQVSNMGNVRSLERQTSRGQNRKGKFLTKTISDNGYPKVSLSKDGKATRFFVHRLVAISFIPNPEHKREVNHINGIKTDNRVCNLEWVSSRENKLHAFETRLRTQDHLRKLTYEQAEEIREKHSKGISIYALAKEYGKCYKNIKAIVDCKLYKTK